MKKSEKIRNNQKKSEKIEKKLKKKLSEIFRKIINNTCMYVYMYDILAIFDQSWKKKERRR